MPYIANSYLNNGFKDTNTLWLDLLKEFKGKELSFATTKSSNIDEYRKKISEIVKKDDIIIQNATFFGYNGGRVISFLQDNVRMMLGPNSEEKVLQENCLDNSTINITNSIQMTEWYKDYKFEVIPVGVDSDFFKNINIKKNNLRKIGLFIGSPDYKKGWDIFLDVVRRKKDINFIAVLKSDFTGSIPQNLKIFKRLNHIEVRKIIINCDFFIHTSRFESQCLSAIECGFLNKPIIIGEVGIFYKWQYEHPGIIVKEHTAVNFSNAINNLDYSKDIRKIMFNAELSKKQTLEKWKNILKKIENKSFYINNNLPKKYIVNDYLTCIPGTKTLWHDLLEIDPAIRELTFDTTFSKNMDEFRANIKKIIKPKDIVIQNASFIGYNGGRVISYLQDNYVLMQGKESQNVLIQNDVLKNSEINVCNSIEVANSYSDYNFTINPIGTDSDFFVQKKYGDKKTGLFIGAPTYEKGWDIFLEIVNKMDDYNWIAVLKTKNINFNIPNNLKIFNIVSHTQLRDIIDESGFFIHTSRFETQCLSAIECGFMNKPIIIKNIGIFKDWKFENPGSIILDSKSDSFIGAIKNLEYERDIRKIMFDAGLSKKQMIDRWKNIFEKIK